MRICSLFLRLDVFTLVLAAASVRAQDGLERASSEARKTHNLLSSSLGLKFIAADFDNDPQPGGAVLLDAGKLEGRQQVFRVKLRIASGPDRELTFQSIETALTILALDVNQDGMLDLIVKQVFTHKRLQVWLNDGHGRFRPARVEDFPPWSEAPCCWKSSIEEPGCLILAIPSRTGNDHAAPMLRIQSFNSSSSHWRIWLASQQAQAGSLAFHSPRSPPSLPRRLRKLSRSKETNSRHTGEIMHVSSRKAVLDSGFVAFPTYGHAKYNRQYLGVN